MKVARKTARESKPALKRPVGSAGDPAATRPAARIPQPAAPPVIPHPGISGVPAPAPVPSPPLFQPPRTSGPSASFPPRGARFGIPPRPGFSSAPPPPPPPPPEPAKPAPVVAFRFPQAQLDKLIKEALAEDIGEGDPTSQALFAPRLKARAKLVANEDGVLAGLPVFKRVLELVDKNVTFEARATDGMALASGQLVARISGPALSVLLAERTALNFVQHLSGIATQTAKFANAVKGTKTRILDTRRTTPGLRFLEKYAVEVGGGISHQRTLADRLVVSEAHLALSEGVASVVRTLKKAQPGRRIELTVTNMNELEQALLARVNMVLLDSFPPGQVRQAIALIQGRAKVEVSGKVGLDNARAYALAGVDYISVSQVTQSVRAFDFSLRISR